MGGPKAAIVTEVGQIYFGATGGSYIGGDMEAALGGDWLASVPLLSDASRRYGEKRKGRLVIAWPGCCPGVLDLGLRALKALLAAPISLNAKEIMQGCGAWCLCELCPEAAPTKCALRASGWKPSQRPCLQSSDIS